ncbi:ABC transporter substrate-binding protein [Acidimangrovimonas sediminis]|uniref:ABC transporter substrate-binding protein n=1 Tax=Acidimangrovimonas sediminis TaxID=2056283 RepID=UPI000C7FBD6B|nr:ABC transporter substrate-binding protein [Acidimangrovimonas sediminis]
MLLDRALRSGVVALGLTLAATASHAASSDSTPVKGGRLDLVVQPEPPGLMIGIITNGPSLMVGGSIYEGLLRYTTDLKPEPSLAKSWEISKDGLTYTFHLQPDVKFSDGKPMTAEDVVFTMDKFLTTTKPKWREVMRHVASVTAPDDNTVVFKMKEPYGPFIRSLSYNVAPIVPEHIYKGTDFLKNPANDRPVGTGPFMLKEWKKGSYIELDRNPYYWKKGHPYLDQVVYHVIPDAASRATAFQTGTVKVLPGGSVENFDIPRLAKGKGVCLSEKGWEYNAPLSFMWLNNREKPLSNPKVRQAIMYALNRKLMLKVLWNGYGKVASGPITSTIPFFDKVDPQYSYNPKKAKELLKEAGYDGKPLRLLPLPYGETWQRWAEVVKQNLKAVGMPVEIESTDVAGWNQKTSQWDYDIAFTYLYENGDPAIGVARNYISSQIQKGNPFNNVEGYSNPKVDKLFSDAAVAADPKDRQKLYTEVQKTLQADVPVAWLLELSFPTLYDCNIHNLIETANGVGNSLGDTWIAK